MKSTTNLKHTINHRCNKTVFKAPFEPFQGPKFKVFQGPVAKRMVLPGYHIQGFSRSTTASYLHRSRGRYYFRKVCLDVHQDRYNKRKDRPADIPEART